LNRGALIVVSGLLVAALSACGRTPDQRSVETKLDEPIVSKPIKKPPAYTDSTSTGISSARVETLPNSEGVPPVSVATRAKAASRLPGALKGTAASAPKLSINPEEGAAESLATGQTLGIGRVSESTGSAPPTRDESGVAPASRKLEVPVPAAPAPGRNSTAPSEGPPISLTPNIDG
jgi:hypothetical protein